MTLTNHFQWNQESPIYNSLEERLPKFLVDLDGVKFVKHKKIHNRKHNLVYRFRCTHQNLGCKAAALWKDGNIEWKKYHNHPLTLSGFSCLSPSREKDLSQHLITLPESSSLEITRLLNKKLSEEDRKRNDLFVTPEHVKAMRAKIGSREYYEIKNKRRKESQESSPLFRCRVPLYDYDSQGKKNSPISVLKQSNRFSNQSISKNSLRKNTTPPILPSVSYLEKLPFSVPQKLPELQIPKSLRDQKNKYQNLKPHEKEEYRFYWNPETEHHSNVTRSEIGRCYENIFWVHHST
eukprot:gb/GECH01004985.1/.p1 GENE.gb/GECH01004985.1/~~gb/GECH01004985.1/.p1  ORF type:complete len:293 (+),score=52.52 gb/GECH01004985.1/:1-879(+)